MKFSVLMSVYYKDDPYFLNIALKSIYDDQTRKPDEIIVVFDGPLSKELYNVLDEFKQSKEEIVKYVPQKENKGLGAALKIGVDYCTGDYIFRMDSDDISDKYRFEKQIAFLEKNPEIDVFGSQISEFNSNMNEKNQKIRRCCMDHENIVIMSKRRNPMNHVTVCIKRNVLLNVENYESLKYVEDYYLWIRLINGGCKFANLDEVLVYVRVGNGFATRRGYTEQISSWKVLQNYMLANGMISKKNAKQNMLYIKVFVKCPSWIKKIVYRLFLRK